MILSVQDARNFKNKVIGLIGTKKPQSLYFETRWGIHTFGVRFPIDVVILDDEDVVRKITQNLKPNRIFAWNPQYKKVIELPTGTIEKEHIRVGEKIELQFTIEK